MKNNLLVLLCLNNINFIQTEAPKTPATSKMRAAALAEFKKKYTCYGLAYQLFLKEQFEKSEGSCTPELITKFAHLQSHFNNTKCDKYQDEIYGFEQITAIDNKKTEELTIEELCKKEAADIIGLKNKYEILKIRKEFDISQEEINELFNTICQEIEDIFSEKN
ncbi:hypothetical protein KBB68_02935 [Candidatus Babeliales bacterium]|nr:hypothetical protein [Candidatus Babeliales bacterium]